MPSPIRGISSMATRNILAALTDAYRQKTGQRVEIESVGGVDAAKRIRAGEAFDLIVLAGDAMAKLDADGFLKAGSRKPVADSAIAVAVPSGDPAPDLSSEAALKECVLKARTIGFSTGPSGNHVLKVFKGWGIEAKIADRLVQAPTGVQVGQIVAEGKVALGFQQLSELLDVPGIDLFPDLPAPVQSITTFTAGIGATSANVAATEALIAFLTGAETTETKIRFGMAQPKG